MTLFHTCCETLHRSTGGMKVNERRTVVGGLIGHCVPPPQPWREIDAHVCLRDIKRLWKLVDTTIRSWRTFSRHGVCGNSRQKTTLQIGRSQAQTTSRTVRGGPKISHQDFFHYNCMSHLRILFHWHCQQNICKDLTSHQMRRYPTVWNNVISNE